MINLSQATEELARRLADAQRLPVEDAIQDALEHRARAAGVPLNPRHGRDTSPEAVARRQARFDESAERLGGMPIRDSRSPQEIMDDLNDL